MSHIEFLGPPGSGKTTLYTGLSDGDHLYSPFVGSSGRNCRSKGANRRFHRKVWNAVRFLRHRPAYAGMLARLGRRATHEPLFLIEMLLGTAAEYEYAVTTRPPQATVVLDEGFLQRALSILFRTDQPSFSLETYLEIVPLPSILVHVDAPATTCETRQENRDKDVLSKPWIETDDTVRIIDELRADCARIVDRAERLGVSIIRVENTGSIDDSITQIRQELRVLLENDS